MAGDGRRFINMRDCLALAMLVMGSFAIETTLGLIITPLSPIPLLGGLVSGLFDAVLIFLAVYLVPRIGAPIFFATILLALSTVTPSFGPVGAYKIVIGIALGATIELLLLIIGRTAVSYMIAVATSFALSIPFTVWAWKWFGIAGADRLESIMVVISGVYFILGFAGAYFGYVIYKKRLVSHPAVCRLRDGV